MSRILISTILWLLAFSVFAQLQPQPSSWFDGRQDAHCCAVDAFGRMWIGTSKEIFIDDGESCFPLLVDQRMDIPQSLGSSYVSDMIIDENQTLWVSTVRGGLFAINTLTGEMQNWNEGAPSGNGPESEIIWQSVKSNGKLWFGAERGGLHEFDPMSGEFIKHHHPEPPKSRNRQIIRDIIVDKNDSNLLWLASLDGLFSYYVPEKKFEFQYFPEDEMIVTYAPHIQGFFTLCQTDDGKIWLGTWYDGLHSYDPKSKEWKQYIYNYPILREPSSNLVYNLSANGKYLGISSFSLGFRLFDTEKESFIEFDGISFDHEVREFRNLNNFAFGNKIFIPRPNGSFELKLRDQDSVYQFPPYVRRLQIASDDTLNYALFIPELGEIDHNAEIQIEFGSTRLFDQNIELDYRINGTDWQTVRPFEAIDLQGLGGGKQSIDLRYRWDDGEWQVSPAVLEFSIHKPWFSYRLVQVAFILLLGALIYTWIASLKKKKRKQEEREEYFKRRLAEVQMEALRSQMNPHFLFNSLNSIKDFIIRNEQQGAVSYLQKFSELIRAILENSKANRISLAEELETVKLYVEMESLRFGGKISLSIDLERCKDKSVILVPPLIIQPYVENSILHGLVPKDSGGTIEISCHASDDELSIEIRDDGIGREASKARKERNLLNKRSMGMDITRERIGLVSGAADYKSRVEIEDLYNDSDEACGTQIKLTLPLEKKAEI